MKRIKIDGFLLRLIIYNVVSLLVSSERSGPSIYPLANRSNLLFEPGIVVRKGNSLTTIKMASVAFEIPVFLTTNNWFCVQT